MTFRRDRILRAGLLVLLALPALAGTGSDPLAEAASAIEQGDGISAEVAARRALRAGASEEAVSAYLGEAAILEDDLVEARRWLGPGRFDAASAQRGFHALGRLELASEDFAAAARAFDRALQAGGGSARLWVDIGRMRYRGGEQHLAADAAARALAIDPMEPQALAFRGILIRESKGLLAALPWFAGAVKRAPGDIGLLGEYAATLGELGRYKEMLRIARRMVAIDREHPRAYYLQAVLAARARRNDLARRLLWRTEGAYAETPAGILLEGVLEYRSGNPALAVERFDELARRQPDNRMVAQLLGRALLAVGDEEEVVARFEALTAVPGAPPYLLTLVARAHEQAGRRDLASPFLDRAALGPDRTIRALPLTREGELAIYRWGDEPARPEVAVQLVRQMLSQGRAAEAAVFARELTRRYPGSADIEVLAGDASLLAGDPAAAMAFYGSAAKVRWNAALAERIAAAQRLLGRRSQAEQALAAYHAAHPGERSIAAALGREAAANGDWRRAAVLLGRAAGLSGGAGDPELLAHLARAQLATGDLPSAHASAGRAYRLQRSSVRATEALAAVSAARQDGAGSDVLFAKVRRMASEPALALR
jgi:tetratricopeptide (TPR) repeat protein